MFFVKSSITPLFNNSLKLSWEFFENPFNFNYSKTIMHYSCDMRTMGHNNFYLNAVYSE